MTTFWYVDDAIKGSRDIYRSLLIEEYKRNPKRHTVFYGGLNVGKKHKDKPICGLIDHGFN